MRSSAFEIFKKYFSSLNARNHEFCQAIWPLLSDWQSFSGKNQLFMQLERLAKKQSSDVHFACVKALKRYMNSRDFHHEARYSSTSYLGGLFSYTYATTAFAAWNKKLDDYLINLSSSEKSQNYGVSYKAMFINGLSSTITATQKIISKGLSTFASHPMTSACVIAVFFQMIRIKADPINGLYDPSLPPDEGGVFMVNSDAQSDYLYSDSCTATLADNSVIAVFNGKVNEPHHGFGLYAQRLYFDGVKRNNTLVNDAVYTQISPAVIRLKDNYLISWLHKPVQAYAGKILAQRFDLNNNQLGNPVRLVKISTPSGTPPSGTNIPTARTDLGVLPNGGYVLTFENADADTVGVYIRMFSAESAPVTKAIRVNTLTSGLQTFHSSKQPLAILPNGEFVVTWSSYSHQGNKAIYLQRFSKTGHRIGNNTQVNDRIHTIDIPFVHTGFSAAAASFADGHVLITWSSREDTTAPIRVNGQLYDLDNRAVGGNFLITPDFVHAYAPTMATFADNSVVLAYYAAYLNASNIPTMVYTQKLRLNHTTRGITMDQPFLVSSTDLANMQNKTYVIPLNPDNYFVTWHRREVVSGDGNVFGRLLMSPQFKQYSTIPVVQGVPIRLNTTYLEATTFDEANPHYLSYSVTGLEHAYINSITGEPTTYFTQQTVNQNQITLVPDGSKHPPRLNLTIHHGRLKKPDQGVFIDFTRQPPILTRAAWQVISRTFVPITLANINASDLGYPHDALWVNVTEQSDGAYFCDPHNIQRYRAFQLQQIKRGQIYFFADRPPSVSLIVSDAYTVNSQPIKANITYYPGLSLSCSFILKQGQWLSLTNTVVDAEEEGFSYKKFSFIANFQHAQLKVGQRIFNASQSDILFSGEDILNGRVAFFSNTDINKLPMLTLTVTGASLQTLTRDCSVNYFVPPVLKQRYHFELNPRR
ncbi:MAG: hypothetical protein K0U12_00290, partial [Gammaproteobacteria bacterium]|nr:hypothetical protein [Gammaproteobacteria bacterium]